MSDSCFIINYHRYYQKIDAPPHLKRCGLNGARFLDANKIFCRFCCTEIFLKEEISCAQSVDHILKDVVSSKTNVFECAQKSEIFDIGRHFDIK